MRYALLLIVLFPNLGIAQNRFEGTWHAPNVPRYSPLAASGWNLSLQVMRSAD
jgi:hypothetical protein